jgi:hypothetical protein
VVHDAVDGRQETFMVARIATYNEGMISSRHS